MKMGETPLDCVCVCWCRCSSEEVSGGRDVGRRGDGQPQLYVSRRAGDSCAGEWLYLGLYLTHPTLPSFSLQVAALSEYWEPTVSQLLFTVSSVEEFTRGGRVEFGGDLQAVGMLIDQLLSLHRRLRGTTSLSDRDAVTLVQVRDIMALFCLLYSSALYTV